VLRLDTDRTQRLSAPQVRPEPLGDKLNLRITRRSLLVVVTAGAALALLLALVLTLPEHLLHSAVSADGERLLKARSDLRGQLLQAVGALFFIVTATLSWRQLRLNQQTVSQQVMEAKDNLAILERQAQIAQDDFLTDRFSRSIEQLANDSVAIRLGGLYVLMRLARASDADQALVVDVLAAFVRGAEQHIGPGTSEPSSAPLRRRAPDIHAAVSFLASRDVEKRRRVIDLSGADLRGADLLGAQLSRADMTGAILDDALMTGAHFEDAEFSGASLRRAKLTGARLDGANLYGAHLVDAILVEACMDGANVTKVDFSGADVSRISTKGVLGAEEALWPVDTRVWPGPSDRR
jgi:uncharacterized protein YjbI with pentapeptide repeats